MEPGQYDLFFFSFPFYWGALTDITENTIAPRIRLAANTRHWFIQ
jgi:hypothetical protein